MQRKILLLTSIYPPDTGGPAIFASRFSKWLSDQRIQNQVITYSTQMGENRKNSYIKLTTPRILSFLKFVLTIIFKIDKQTLILANGVFIETYIACKIRRANFIAKIPGDLVWEISRNRGWTISDLDTFQSEKLNFFQFCLRKLQNLSLKSAKHVIVPSYQLKNLCELWGVKNSKISVIFNSVDSEVFTKFDTRTKEYDLVSVCRLVPWKGLEELIRTVKALNLSLALVGDGPLLEELKLLDSNQGKIVFFGNMNNQQVVSILNKSRVFILNSTYEATSYAIIEAKMCGLPVLARETDGSSILVRDSIDGYLYSDNRKITIQDAINKILNSEALISKFGNNSREDALLRFNQSINFQMIYNLVLS